MEAELRWTCSLLPVYFVTLTELYWHGLQSNPKNESCRVANNLYQLWEEGGCLFLNVVGDERKASTYISV
jgi:hypothetical protein